MKGTQYIEQLTLLAENKTLTIKLYKIEVNEDLIDERQLGYSETMMHSRNGQKLENR